MKLVLVIVSSYAADDVISALNNSGFRVTVAATAGGFLQRGNASIFAFVADDQVEQVMEIVARTAKPPPEPRFHRPGLGTRHIGRATVFVLNVEHVEAIPGVPVQPR